jgi:hypothetical protein
MVLQLDAARERHVELEEEVEGVRRDWGEMRVQASRWSLWVRKHAMI